MATTTDTYVGFNGNRDALVSILKRARSQFSTLQMTTNDKEISGLLDRLESDSFKVMVLGEFKRGKSTFINALLGEEVLPAYAVPCTAVINEVKWGDEPQALAHFKVPLPTPLPERLPDAVRDHIAAAAESGEVPPMAIPVDELEAYVVIDDPGKDQAESVAETPYAKVELFWPLDLCRQRVEIIDSPGLNEHGTRTQVTTQYLREVDAILFVISCTSPVSQSELRVIEDDIRGNGHEEIFFIFNRADQVGEKDRARLQSYAQDKLSDLTAMGDDGIFFVSSLNALNGRIQNEPALLAGSGLPELEGRLADFLVHDRGRVKLLQPARELRAALRDAIRTRIPGIRQMLEQDSHALRARYEEVQPKLKDAESRRDDIVAQCETGRHRLADAVRRSTGVAIRDLAGQLPEWAAEFEPENSIKVLKMATLKGQMETLMRETIAHLTERLEHELSGWKREELVPTVEQHMATLHEQLGLSTDAFMAQIHEIRTDLTGVEHVEMDDKDSPSTLERFACIGGAILMGDPGSALTGGTFGWREMVKTMAVNLGVLTVGIFLVGLNPFILLPLMLATGIAQSKMRQDALTQKVVQKVAEMMASKLKESVSEQSEAVVAEVNNQTVQFQQAVSAGLQAEIDAIRDEVEQVLAEKEQGEAAVAERRAAVEGAARQLDQLDDDLTQFMLDVSESSLQAAR